MRTTISIDDRLLDGAKRRARRLSLTLGQLVEAALRRELGRPAATGGSPEIPVFDGQMGFRKGIDATSTAAILEELDRDRLGPAGVESRPARAASRLSP